MTYDSVDELHSLLFFCDKKLNFCCGRKIPVVIANLDNLNIWFWVVPSTYVVLIELLKVRSKNLLRGNYK